MPQYINWISYGWEWRTLSTNRNSEQCFLGILASSDLISQMKHLKLQEVRFVFLEICLAYIMKACKSVLILITIYIVPFYLSFTAKYNLNFQERITK